MEGTWPTTGRGEERSGSCSRRWMLLLPPLPWEWEPGREAALVCDSPITCQDEWFAPRPQEGGDLPALSSITWENKCCGRCPALPLWPGEAERGRAACGTMKMHFSIPVSEQLLEKFGGRYVVECLGCRARPLGLGGPRRRGDPGSWAALFWLGEDRSD